MNEQVMELAVTDEPVEIDIATSPEDEPHDVPLVPEQFCVKDAASASWVAKKINEARAYAKRVAAWADREVRRAERDEQFLLMRYGQQLQDFAAREIARLRGRRRSVCLPGGTLGFRKVGPTLLFDDPEAVLKWARQSCPTAVITRQTVSKSTVNQHVEATGELPDGSRVEESRDRFYVS